MKSLLTLFVALLVVFMLPAQNQNISNGIVFDGEPYLVVNPNDNDHLVAAWMGFVPFAISIKTSVSTDGGSTWSLPNSIPHVNPQFGSADPSLGFDSQGNVLLTYIDFSFALSSGAVYCVRSTDGGFNWGTPVSVIGYNEDPNKTPIDRPWMAVDRSGGPTDGHVYVTSMSAGTNDPSIVPPYHPYLIRSTDGGQTFLPFRRLDTTNFESGSLISTPMPTPTVASNGTFYAAYPAYVPSQNLFARAVLTTSTDGGVNLNYSERNILFPTLQDDDAKRASILRVNPADPNHLIAIALMTIHGDGDVFLQETFDAGANWTSPVRVNDDPIGNDRMQDMVWADFDDDGDLVVTWRDRRNATDSTYDTASEIWGAVRLKNKSTFEPNFPLTDNIVPYDTILAESGNDFMCVELQDDTISVVWGDVRTGRLNIWFQRLDLQGVVLSNQLLAFEMAPEVQVFPNPVAQVVRVEAEGMQRVELWDGNGKQLLEKRLEGENEWEMDLAGYPAGVLWLRIETEGGETVRKLMRME